MLRRVNGAGTVASELLARLPTPFAQVRRLGLEFYRGACSFAVGNGAAG